MEKINILWVDDEIDLLKPHILFLQEKGFQVVTTNNGHDALELIKNGNFDLVFLDENMPGLSGLETLSGLKKSKPNIPVVMITKSEEENLMDEAIGSKISDYLIKPVNPKQILLSIKKNIDANRLVSEKITSDYQQEFRNIGMELNGRLSFEEWTSVYDKLIYWELELGHTNDKGMDEVLKMQKTEANQSFCKFIQSNYISWLNPSNSDHPVMSHTLFKNKAIPILKNPENSLFFILIDNLRLDQWKTIRPNVAELFNVDTEGIYFSILPTATQYSRNSIFSGLLPSEIEKIFPELWVGDTEEGGKNLHEESLITHQLRRNGIDVKFSYSKIANLQGGKKLLDHIPNLMNNKLNVIVYNFVDILSHARTEMEVIKELSEDESAYRSLTLSWFEHSPLLGILKRIADLAKSQKNNKIKLIITTDHGTIQVKDPSKIIGDKNTTANLRYKEGKSLTYEPKDVFVIGNPDEAFLPKSGLSSRYVFAKENNYFVYPSNYNYYVNLYRNTFQHGGISMEEMMIPIIGLSLK